MIYMENIDMNLFQKTEEICKKNNIIPSRSKGQNFLIEENIYDRIVEVARINKDDTVLEVGPGLGFLTEKLAEKAGRVVAVELDDVLAGLLGRRFDKVENVEVVNENILDFNFKFEILNFNSIFNDLIINESEKKDKLEIENLKLNKNLKLKIKNYKVVANLPYNITSIFLRKFLESENKPETMTLMLQKEVAERIVAKPGKMSLLAVSVQFYADAEIVGYVPRGAFWPVPAVESAVIKLEVRSKKLEIDNKAFFRMVKFGFGSRRKMLKNNLAGCYKIGQEKVGEWFKECGFDEKIRAQELSVDDWIRLFGVIE